MNCSICQGNNLTIFHKYEMFTLLKCNDCTLVFQNQEEKINIPEMIKEIYDVNWVQMREQGVQSTFLTHANFGSLLMNMHSPKKGKLLEIGSGTGEFLFAAKSSGWEEKGFEPSSVSCQYAKNKYNVNVVNSLWSKELLSENEKFDAVAFWHVFEHIPNPHEFLEDVKSILKPDGLIYISIPNLNSFTNQLDREYSVLFTEPDHLFHYSKETLEKVLDQCGLEPFILFSRESDERMLSDLDIASALRIIPNTIDITAFINLQNRIQASFEGHEIFCVAKVKKA